MRRCNKKTLLIVYYPDFTCCEKVEGWVGCHDPESVVVPPEGLEGCPLGHVPHPDRLVLRVGQDQLLPRVERHARHVVVVATARVHLPGLNAQISVLLLSIQYQINILRLLEGSHFDPRV